MVDVLEAYIPLINHIARSACFSSAAIDINDLYQIGRIAALRAIKEYDPSCGSNIKSFVSRLVKQEIYHEAGRFLGVFTVDHRTTNLASKVNRLANDGKSDEEIVDILSDRLKKTIDIQHVKDLRLAYSRKQSSCIDEESIECHTSEDIQTILEEAAQTPQEKTILQDRILGNVSASIVAKRLSISVNNVYLIERNIKSKIKLAIENIIQ